MNFTKKIVLTAILLLVVGIAGLTWLHHDKALADATSFSGQATVVQATVLGQTTTLADTGPLPSTGDALAGSSLEAHVPGLLNADVLDASTIGIGNRTDSAASLANLDLTVGGNSISADFLMARAAAVCSVGSPATSGSSEIDALKVNGISVPVTGVPNQTINLLNGEIVVNEQSSDGTGQIMVNAIHVVVPGVADVVIGHASAGATCPGQLVNTLVSQTSAASQPSKDEFVTGGGWITGTPTGDKGNFGVGGGIRNEEFWGHLTYVDQDSQLKAKGTEIILYCAVDATTRRIVGNAEINGLGGFLYTVEVSDNGESGRNDTFSIILSNGYVAQGTLGGGNIQLHNPQNIVGCENTK